jgi:prepilin-type N-terminal cleavage/methylation domain-containing protein
MKKRLQAFTLIELLVAMLISSAVISSAFLIYRTFAKNMIDYKSHINKLSDAVVLNGILSHDMNIAKAVKKSNLNDIAMEQGSKNVQYEWQDQAVLRRTDISCDTFHLIVNNIKVNFMNKEQVLSGGLIDELKFTSVTDGHEFIFYFEKKYGSDILVESENNPDGWH